MQNNSSILKNPLLLKTIKSSFLRSKKRWLFWLCAGPSVPFIEMVTIGGIFLVISKDNLELVKQKITSHPWLPDTLLPYISNYMVELVLVAALIFLVLQIGLKYLVEVNGQQLRYRMEIFDATRLTSNYLNASPQAAYQIGKNQVTTSILQDSGALGSFSKIFVDTFIAAWSAAIYLIGSLFISWEILLVAVALYGLPFWLSRHMYAKMKDIGVAKVEAQERSLAFFGDIFQGFLRSKLDALEKNLIGRAKTIIHFNFHWRIAKRRLQSKFKSLMEGLSLLGLIITLYIGLEVLEVDLSMLFILFVIFNRIKSYTSQISSNLFSYKELLPNLERYYKLIGDFSHIKSGLNLSAPKSDIAIKDIRLENVDYAYPGEKSSVLSNINLFISVGDRILITGPSGQGKSTLLEIIMGFLPPTSGRVLYSNHVLNDGMFYNIRNQTAYSSPTVYLLQGTLRENLLVGDYNDKSRLEEAIHLAGLSEFIQSLPNGLDTDIGIDGEFLSLGQRQRVILARLYMKRPKLFFLDEAMSNLDSGLEGDVVGRLQEFVDPDSIVLMVAHKVPKNFIYNRHIIMENGKLEEQLISTAIAGE